MHVESQDHGIATPRTYARVGQPSYQLIQVLRAVAAIMVVMHHVTQVLRSRYHLSINEWPNGAAGVDIFFVISGFVMTLSSQKLSLQPHPARVFIIRRWERIVPLYWMLTAIKVILVRLRPASSLNGIGSVLHVVCSFLFLPAVSLGRVVEPVLVMGWTLNLEMFFYGVFALALSLRWKVVRFVIAVLIFFALITFIPGNPAQGFWEILLFYCNPIILEFGFGVILASYLQRARSLSWPVASLLLLSSFSYLLLSGSPRSYEWRVVDWGVPAMAIVWGAVALEGRVGERAPRWLVGLGDSSYSLYLVHAFILPSLSLSVVAWVARRANGAAIIFLVLVLLSILAGESLYRIVELPMLRWARSRRSTIPSNADAVLTGERV